MEVLVIADAHVGQRAGDAGDMVELVGRAREAGVRHIVYLGDAFQYLIGMSKLWTSAVREVMRAWDAARAAGMTIGIVEGNRDFFLDHRDLSAHIDWCGRMREETIGNVRFRFVHGDLVNRRDVQYRFWARLSKSGLARAWAQLLPQRLAVGIVRRMEARLAVTNTRFRYLIPVADLEREAGRAFAEGVDVLMLGHFHRGWRLRRDHRTAAVIPAWLETGLAVGIRADGGWTLVDPDLTPSNDDRTMA